MSDDPIERTAEVPRRGGGTWDQRIARVMVRPLVNTPVTPNQITTLRLFVGLTGAAFLALGDADWSNWGAGLFMFSNLIDHADGELARLAHKTSAFGHRFDVACDALVHVLLFTSLGIGLRESPLEESAIGLGILAGLGVSALFWLFGHRAKLFEKDEVQPRWGGFDLEDLAYLVGPAIWLGWQLPLLVVSAAVAPLTAVFLLWHHRETLNNGPGAEGGA